MSSTKPRILSLNSCQNNNERTVWIPPYGPWKSCHCIECTPCHCNDGKDFGKKYKKLCRCMEMGAIVFLLKKRALKLLYELAVLILWISSIFFSPLKKSNCSLLSQICSPTRLISRWRMGPTLGIWTYPFNMHEVPKTWPYLPWLPPSSTTPTRDWIPASTTLWIYPS